MAAVVVPTFGTAESGGQYDDAIPYLMEDPLPNGVLGIAATGLPVGMAAHVSSFNTVFTTDIWATYVVRDREDGYYIRFDRLSTAIGVLASIGTASSGRAPSESAAKARGRSGSRPRGQATSPRTGRPRR